MKKYYTQGGGLQYSSPTIEILNISIEKGFSDSIFGPEGGAGNNFEGGNEYEF